jgi:hypothetical protein
MAIPSKVLAQEVGGNLTSGHYVLMGGSGEGRTIIMHLPKRGSCRSPRDRRESLHRGQSFLPGIALTVYYRAVSRSCYRLLLTAAASEAQTVCSYT